MRYAHDEVDDPVDDGVDALGAGRRHDADQHRDDSADDGGGKTDRDAHGQTLERAQEKVASQGVRAEGVLKAGRLLCVEKAAGYGVVGDEYAAGVDGCEQEEDNDGQNDDFGSVV